jgi:hypothetical protein
MVLSSPRIGEGIFKFLCPLVSSNSFRLQVTLAKLQQSLPELKRDGSTVLSSLWANIIYDQSSTSRGGGILQQLESVPLLAKELQENPEKVVRDFEAIRTACG